MNESDTANVDVLEFPKMKIDFTNDIDKVVVSSDVKGEHLEIDAVNTTISADTIKSNRLVICGVDVTDEILELYLKNLKKLSKS